MRLRNYMEGLVLDEIEKVLETKEDMCKCEKCRLDIAALSLNAIPTRYIVSEKGDFYMKENGAEEEYAPQIARAVEWAIDVVKASIKHED